MCYDTLKKFGLPASPTQATRSSATRSRSCGTWPFQCPYTVDNVKAKIQVNPFGGIPMVFCEPILNTKAFEPVLALNSVPSDGFLPN